MTLPAVAGGPAVAPEGAPATAPAPAPIADGDGRPSLVVQTSFLGDTILTTPLVARLARRGPVDVVVTPAAAPVLANNPGIRDLVAYDKRGDASGLTGLWRASRELAARSAEAGGYRAAYLAQGSMRSATLALLAGVRERVGFATSAGRPLYTRVVPFEEDRHHAERLWRLGGPVPDDGLPAAEVRPRLYPGADDVGAVDDLLRAAGHAGEPLIALAPGSVWATQRWPYYRELTRRLPSGARPVVVGADADTPLAREIADAGPPGHAIDLTGRLSLLGSAEVIARCVAIVTNDSAPLHLASAMATPTIAVFGPTVPEFGFGPLAPRSATVGHSGLACRPCDRHGPRRCPLGHWHCMREISADAVAGLVRDLTLTPSA
ncbi:MAG TPA: glycosyltransferase family 9 protein [Gemmatimonadaceae bacterium]|nr:glycosyltransferase family 9 protein [Gemmatimonadaceae bacterium]